MKCASFANSKSVKVRIRSCARLVLFCHVKIDDPCLIWKKMVRFYPCCIPLWQKKNNNAQNRLTADIPCYSWLKMGKGPVILIVLSLMVCSNTVSLKSSISGNPFQQGNEFSLKFNIFSKNNCVGRKPYLIFKNRIHISYIEDCAITKPFGLSKFISRIIFLL